MAKGKKDQAQRKSNGANIGYEPELWKAADALRGSVNAAEYKHGTRLKEGNQHAHR